MSLDDREGWRYGYGTTKSSQEVASQAGFEPAPRCLCFLVPFYRVLRLGSDRSYRSYRTQYGRMGMILGLGLSGLLNNPWMSGLSDGNTPPGVWRC